METRVVQLQLWQALVAIAVPIGGMIIAAWSLAFRLGRKAGSLETEKKSFETKVTEAINKLTATLTRLVEQRDEERLEAARERGEWGQWREGVNGALDDHEVRTRALEGRPVTGSELPSVRLGVRT